MLYVHKYFVGWTCCGISPVSFPYNGIHTGSETLTITATGYAHNYPGKLTITAGSSAPATLLAINYPQGQVNQYSASANGNVAPVRAVLVGPRLVGCLCEDLQGNFWLGTTQFSNVNAVLGSVVLQDAEFLAAVDSNGNLYGEEACGTLMYPPGFGTSFPIREIDFAWCPSQPAGAGIAVDASGDLFAGSLATATSPAHIYEYPPAGSGSIQPTRAISMPAAGAYSGFLTLDTDAAGNLYGLYVSMPPPGNPQIQLWEFAPGATTGQQLLSGVPLDRGLAVDDQGDVFVSVSPQSSQGAIEEFAPGSSTPEVVIQGSNTQLTIGYRGSIGPIAIPRTR
jgi:hypothetical protein